MVGMKTETRAITNETEVKVTLEEEASDLEEAIVIGYGTSTKKDLTGSVARFDSQILEESVATNVADMLQGQVPGLSILSGSGAPGDPARLEIRGVSSLSNVSPLIVVDDVPMPSDFDINELNPGDIKSIDVLKGASSAAIYGSRAAGGVIMITTKGGQRMQAPTITYDYSTSFESLTEPINTLTVDEFKMLVMEAARNTARINGYDDITEYSAYKKFAEPDFWGEADTPWMKYILRNGSTQQHRVALRGGGANIGYTGDGVTLCFYDVDFKNGEYQRIVVEHSCDKNYIGPIEQANFSFYLGDDDIEDRIWGLSDEERKSYTADQVREIFADKEPIAVVRAQGTTNWGNKFGTDGALKEVTGVHNLYIVYNLIYDTSAGANIYGVYLDPQPVSGGEDPDAIENIAADVEGIRAYSTGDAIVVNADEAATVALYTMNGMLVANEQVAAGTTTLNNLNAGLYILRITNAEGQTDVVKALIK